MWVLPDHRRQIELVGLHLVSRAAPVDADQHLAALFERHPVLSLADRAAQAVAASAQRTTTGIDCPHVRSYAASGAVTGRLV